MENKQTAVEWLREKLFKDFGLAFSDNIFQEAKKMEKEQRINAQMDMFHYLNDMPYGMAYLAKKDSAEEFCETYKSN